MEHKLPFGLSEPPPEGFIHSVKIDTGIKSPSIIQQIKNVTVSTIRHVAGGMPQVLDEERDARMAICKECPFFNNEDPENPKCFKCGCYLKIKTSWALESCPEGRWGQGKKADCGCNKP